MGLNLLQGAQLSHAEDILNQALAIWERVLGPDHPDTATSCNNLAAVYHAQGRYSEAEPLHQRALAIRERVLGPDHPDTATSCNNLAGVYHDQGRYSEAELLYQRALAIRERVLGPDHPDTATSCNNLAGVYHAQGATARPSRSISAPWPSANASWGRTIPTPPPAAITWPWSTMPRALQRGRAALSARPGHLRTRPGAGPSRHRHGCNNLAAVYRAQGRYSEAEPLYQRALAICERVLGPDHPYTATVMENYVDLLRQMHRDAEADNNNINKVFESMGKEPKAPPSAESL